MRPIRLKALLLGTMIASIVAGAMLALSAQTARAQMVAWKCSFGSDCVAGKNLLCTYTCGPGGCRCSLGY
jgi:purine-cytosine permease-like protein